MTTVPRYHVQTIPAPQTYPDIAYPVLSDDTMKQRLRNVLLAMQASGFTHLVIYADKEHGANFEYLAGFIPRFEEALLVVNADGELSYIMGNENLKLVPFARNGGKCLHTPLFSLPNQPMDGDAPLAGLLASCGIMLRGWVSWAGNYSPVIQRCLMFRRLFSMRCSARQAGGTMCAMPPGCLSRRSGAYGG
jgi:hypothetical protein